MASPAMVLGLCSPHSAPSREIIGVCFVQQALMAMGHAALTDFRLLFEFPSSDPAPLVKLMGGGVHASQVVPPIHVFPVLPSLVSLSPLLMQLCGGGEGALWCPPCTTVISVGEHCPGVPLPQSPLLTVPYKPPGLLAGPCRNLRVFSSSPCPWPDIRCICPELLWP